MITSSGDGMIAQWDVESGMMLSSSFEHTSDVMSLDVRPNDPNIFASCSCDRTIKIWDMRTSAGSPSAGGGSTAKGGGGARGETPPPAPAPSSAGSVSSIVAFPSDVNAVRWFPDSQALGAAGDDHSCRLIDLRCMQEINK